MNKTANNLIVVLLVVLLLGSLGFILWTKVFASNETSASSEPSIEEILKNSVDIPEITTNLKNNDYVKVSFKIQTDGKNAKEELEKRDFQVQNVVISELSEMESVELDGKAGKEHLETTITNKINELMQNGKVERVYITSCVIS